MAHESNEDKDFQDASHEEGEYHFADDQIHYELGEETTKAAPVSAQESLLAKLKSRRTILIVAVFLVLLGIVYRMIVPATPSAVTTQFSAQQPVAAPKPVINTQPVAVQPPAAPVLTQAPATPIPTAAPISPAVPMPTTTSIPTATPIPAAADAARGMNDRLAALEQQTAAIMNVLQTQATQTSGVATQDTDNQNKIQNMNTRIANLEIAFRQLTQILKSMRKQQAVAVGDQQAGVMKVSQPRMKYMVQAIIPGRAWLKAESGDTVTVAEGDILKGYGKVVKIDPYDGVVSIDVGNKVITLCYGSGD